MSKRKPRILSGQSFLYQRKEVQVSRDGNCPDSYDATLSMMSKLVDSMRRRRPRPTVGFRCDPMFSSSSLFIQYCCDFAIYKKMYLVFFPVSGTELPLQNFLSEHSEKGVFDYVNQMAQDPMLGWRLVAREPTMRSEGENSQSHLPSGEGRWDGN